MPRPTPVSSARHIGLLLAAASLVTSCVQFAKVGTAEPEADGSIDPAAGDSGTSRLDGSDAAPSNPGDVTGGSGVAGSCNPEVALCNPITNEGCSGTLGMQCGADLSADTLSGYCTFSAMPPPGGGPCLNTIVTESCPPTTTCIAGTCRTLCFCDAHCGTGECCNEALGEQGFFVCGDC